MKHLLIKISILLLLPAVLCPQEQSGSGLCELSGQESASPRSQQLTGQTPSNPGPQPGSGQKSQNPDTLQLQDLSGLRESVFIAVSDTIILDSLMIVPGSVTLKTFPERELMSETMYRTDHTNSMLILAPDFPFRGQQLVAGYRVFTADPALPLSRRDTTMILPFQRERGSEDPFLHTYRPVSESFWREETLNRSGSISRGISFGNNQDVIVNSNLNLQLSGKLDDNINIVASISDQNIPLQPEGYSQQIHEFDKIFIRLFTDDMSLTAGDFEVHSGGGLFLPLEKKAQGIQFSASFEPTDGRVTNISNTSSAAIAKGRYHSNSFTGMEGNQGPYKLKGAGNETFIIVLAGSERVFVDGRLLERGIDRHYIIDYNLAEITFTPNMPVTKDRRIVVEFEYSDRNYTRFMVANSTGITTGSGEYFLNVFSEHDARNQPLMQDLSAGDKEFLAGLGDDPDRAWVQKVDSMEFRNDLVLYEKADTIINGTVYSIFRYSTDPSSAHFRPSFTNLGPNKGNYRPAMTSANGRVFEWTAPVDGVPTGTHEPVTQLIPPQKHQVVNMGGTTSLGNHTGAIFEVALSNFDRNTFSDIDNDDNVGVALRLGLDNRIPVRSGSRYLEAGVDYQFAGRDFTSTERYRPVEHQRDWDLGKITGSYDEHLAGWYAGYSGNGGTQLSYRGEYLAMGSEYSGLRNSLVAAAGIAGFDSRLSASYLTSETNLFETGFFRHAAELSRQISILRAGIRSEGEDKRTNDIATGALTPAGFAYHQREVFIENADTARLHIFSAYRERDDQLPFGEKMEDFSFAREFSTGFRSVLSPGNHLSGTIHHRRLKPADREDLQTAATENSLNGRLEARLRFLGGSVTGTGMFETGSGLEARREFMFIEVARGQGTHMWTDYNENGIMELDEFEPARFPDQANFLRIMVPSDQFTRVRSNQFSQTIRLTPPASWRNVGGLRMLLSKFSAQTSIQSAQKSTREGMHLSVNPFGGNLTDTSLISFSSSVRNSVSFQPAERVAIEYLNHQSGSRNLLANGFETRQIRTDAFDTRYEATASVTLSARFENGTRKFDSEFFPGRDFNISMTSGKISLSYHPGFRFRSTLHIRHTSKENSLGSEESGQYNAGGELAYSFSSVGSLMFRADYYHIGYNAAPNTPVAWEMLEGLRPGDNMTVMVQWQQTLAGNLQLSLNYHGRVAEGSRFIHTGGMQVMAFF